MEELEVDTAEDTILNSVDGRLDDYSFERFAVWSINVAGKQGVTGVLPAILNDDQAVRLSPGINDHDGTQKALTGVVGDLSFSPMVEHWSGCK